MTNITTTFRIFIAPLLLLFCFTIQAQESVSFMSFNVWQEGTSVPNGLNKIRDVIVESNADIICFSEVRNYNNEDWTTKIVNKLSAAGVTYYGSYVGSDISLISKFPITNSSLIGATALFNVQLNSQLITVACVHLDYTYYACYLPRGYNGGIPNWSMINDGMGNPSPVLDINQILAYNLQSTRDEQIDAFLLAANNLSNPVVLMGDFNEPSHLDWIDSTEQLFDHNGLTIPWQTSLAIENNGFIDSYRDYFPNPVTNPGFTWPSFTHEVGSTSWTPLADERDRIDYIFYKGEGVSTSYAALVGPKESYAYNQTTISHTASENFLADNLPWPSDHKAVYATLNFEAPSNVLDDASEKTLNIFPNPATNSFTVKLEDHVAPLFIEVSNVLGQVIYNLPTENTATLISTNNWSNGIYHVIVKNEVGIVVASRKVVVGR